MSDTCPWRAVTTEKPIQAHIYQVKKQDRGDTFKKKLSWSLRELKVLDAKDATKASCPVHNSAALQP